MKVKVKVRFVVKVRVKVRVSVRVLTSFSASHEKGQPSAHALQSPRSKLHWGIKDPLYYMTDFFWNCFILDQ